SARPGTAPFRSRPGQRCGSAARGLRALRSRIEQRACPAFAHAGEAAAFVQAIGPVDPEFDRLGREAEAGPVRRAGNLLPFVARAEILDPFEICLARIERARLVRSGRAELRHARPRMK